MDERLLCLNSIRSTYLVADEICDRVFRQKSKLDFMSTICRRSGYLKPGQTSGFKEVIKATIEAINAFVINRHKM